MTEQEYSGNEELSEDEARVLLEGRKAASKTVSKLKEHKKKTLQIFLPDIGSTDRILCCVCRFDS